MSALDLFRGKTIDIATTHGVSQVDGLAHGVFHVRPSIYEDKIVYSVSHMPTGMMIPARIYGLSAAADMVVELMALDIDWAEANVDTIRLQSKIVVPIVKKYGDLYGSDTEVRAASIRASGQRLNTGAA